MQVRLYDTSFMNITAIIFIFLTYNSSQPPRFHHPINGGNYEPRNFSIILVIVSSVTSIIYILVLLQFVAFISMQAYSKITSAWVLCSTIFTSSWIAWFR